MRVHVTGATGFVGRWLTRELERAGHTVVGTDRRVDVADRGLLHATLSETLPDGIVHLAAVSYGPDADADTARAFSVNVGGTLNVVEWVRLRAPHVPLLVAGSSEVYGEPHRRARLSEDAPLAPRSVYGLTKAAAESVALAVAARYNLRLAVTRSFNHIGPGQREDFVVPAIAGRVYDVVLGRRRRIPIGNVDVERDFTDVRDVVRSYRLLMEALAEGRLGMGGTVFNVASGRGVRIGEIVSTLAAVASIRADVKVDPALVRPGEPRSIVGDASRLRRAVHWRRSIPLSRTLADVWEELVRARRSGRPVGSGGD